MLNKCRVRHNQLTNIFDAVLGLPFLGNKIQLLIGAPAQWVTFSDGHNVTCPIEPRYSYVDVLHANTMAAREILKKDPTQYCFLHGISRIWRNGRQCFPIHWCQYCRYITTDQSAEYTHQIWSLLLNITNVPSSGLPTSRSHARLRFRNPSAPKCRYASPGKIYRLWPADLEVKSTKSFLRQKVVSENQFHLMLYLPYLPENAMAACGRALTIPC